MSEPESISGQDGGRFDVIVVGGGIGGIYAVHRFTRQGLSVLGLEGDPDVGGVWYHNRYPGARVDVDSLDYCYYFSETVAREWLWTERYAGQPELLEYLNFVADHHDIRRHFRFRTWVTGATWEPFHGTWVVTTDSGVGARARFLVMATGNLSASRTPPFAGLEQFKGDWVLTSRWPERGPAIDGRRVGVVGTGSTGIQVVTAVAPRAESLTVFQRTANWVVPAVNRPLEAAEQKRLVDHLDEERRRLITATASGTNVPLPKGPAAQFSPEEQREMLEGQWAFGGQGMTRVFSDQGRNREANEIVAEFVRSKIRGAVRDPAVAEKLLPHYPIGGRRLVLDTGYYETFTRDNVSLVDVREQPIVEVTERGIRTAAAHYDLDLIIFALGFHAFTGAIDAANICNEHGQSPTDLWARGPHTVLGLMTPGFPNLFFPTGAGGPSLLANLFLNNEFCIDWIGDAITFMEQHSYATIEPTDEAAMAWQAHVADTAAGLLRLGVENYMVHVNDDGSRVYRPYAGGLNQFVERANAIVGSDYEGFVMLETVESDAEQVTS